MCLYFSEFSIYCWKRVLYDLLIKVLEFEVVLDLSRFYLFLILKKKKNVTLTATKSTRVYLNALNVRMYD